MTEILKYRHRDSYYGTETHITSEIGTFFNYHENNVLLTDTPTFANVISKLMSSIHVETRTNQVPYLLSNLYSNRYIPIEFKEKITDAFKNWCEQERPSFNMLRWLTLSPFRFIYRTSVEAITITHLFGEQDYKTLHLTVTDLNRININTIIRQYLNKNVDSIWLKKEEMERSSTIQTFNTLRHYISSNRWHPAHSYEHENLTDDQEYFLYNIPVFYQLVLLYYMQKLPLTSRTGEVKYLDHRPNGTIAALVHRREPSHQPISEHFSLHLNYVYIASLRTSRDVLVDFEYTTTLESRLSKHPYWNTNPIGEGDTSIDSIKARTRNKLKTTLNYTANPNQYITYNPVLPSDVHKKNIEYGIELEVSSSESPSTLMDSAPTPFFIAKNDSSITRSRDYPLELVTIPLSLRSHRTLWKEFLGNLRNDPFDNSVNINNGLHIHIGRNHFKNEGHIKRFLFMFNNEIYSEFLQTISERTDEKWKSWCSEIHYENFESTTPMTYYSTLYSAIIRQGRGRVTAESAKGTIEVRMFRGTPQYDSLIKNIEFVDSLFYFTQDRSILSNTFEQYLPWLNNQPKNRYPSLTSFIFKNRLDEHVTRLTSLKEKILKEVMVGKADKITQLLEKHIDIYPKDFYGLRYHMLIPNLPPTARKYFHKLILTAKKRKKREATEFTLKANSFSNNPYEEEIREEPPRPVSISRTAYLRTLADPLFEITPIPNTTENGE